MKLEGRSALVMGAGSIAPGIGNGKAAALAFAREGAHVLACDVNQEAARETQARIREAGGICEIMAVDVAAEHDVKAAIKRCLALFSRLDILHNNVGLSMWGGVAEVSPADWDRVVATNLRGMYLACHFAIPVMA